jgi:Fe-S-cluster-containing dehydrogenase component
LSRAIFFDEDRCVGCYACIVACKLEHNLAPHPIKPPLSNPKGPELVRVYQVRPETLDEKGFPCFQPTTCRHCPDAPCIEECPTSALYKDIETGLTLVDEDKCNGCKLCLQACPYGSPQFYDDKIYLCDLCLHRIGEKRQKGRQTACEAACPARAIHVGTADEISVLIGKKAAERADKEKST